ncbi:MAG: hypothetical protein K5662_09520 [Lachnospiraceae bacterium]|nr:hypothetical protein [Lachnospiraceae bacterium]
MSEKRNMLITIAFLIILAAVPVSIMLSRLVSPSVEATDGEGNAMSGEESVTYSDRMNGIVAEHVNEFTNSNPYKEQMISANTILSKYASGGHYVSSPQVLLGKDGWLFYKTDKDGQPVEDYMGTHYLSNEELEAAVDNISKAKEVVEASGRRFYVMTIPNKEEVYKAYLPDTVEKLSEYSSLDKFSNYIEENCDVAYIDTGDILNEYKDSHQLYYKTDTHWNRAGAFVALQEFFRISYGDYETVNQVNFTIDGEKEGDLAVVSGLADEYKDAEFVLDETSIDQSLHRDEIVFIVGDSFGEILKPVADAYYWQAHWIRTENFSMELLDEYNADVVIWESVERYLNKYAEYDITAK